MVLKNTRYTVLMENAHRNLNLSDDDNGVAIRPTPQCRRKEVSSNGVCTDFGSRYYREALPSWTNCLEDLEITAH